MNLFTADWHLTSRPQDEYRFGVVPFLTTQIRNRKIKNLFILGDLTDLKDEHPAKLVHRIYDNLVSLADLCEVWIIAGNHDSRDSAEPFFRFVDGHTRLHFISKAAAHQIDGQKALFLPYSRHFRKEVKKWDLKTFDLVLIHQPVKGARSESGQQVEGIRPELLKDAKKVIAGDLHVPQEIKNITYCGSPHPCRFGDDFTPRVLVQDGQTWTSVKRTTIRKSVVHISDPSELTQMGFSTGDQVKVNIHLGRSDLVNWDGIRGKITDICSTLGLILCGTAIVETDVEAKEAKAAGRTGNPDFLLKQYCRENGIKGEKLQLGLKLNGEYDGE